MRVRLADVIGTIQLGVLLLLNLTAFALEVWALIHAASRPAQAYLRAGKRTKPFWVALTGVAAVIGFVLLPPPIGVARAGLFGLVVAIPAIIYLVDVRPAVQPYRRRGGPSGGGW